MEMWKTAAPPMDKPMAFPQLRKHGRLRTACYGEYPSYPVLSDPD